MPLLVICDESIFTSVGVCVIPFIYNFFYSISFLSFLSLCPIYLFLLAEDPVFASLAQIRQYMTACVPMHQAELETLAVLHRQPRFSRARVPYGELHVVQNRLQLRLNHLFVVYFHEYIFSLQSTPNRAFFFFHQRLSPPPEFVAIKVMFDSSRDQ